MKIKEIKYLVSPTDLSNYCLDVFVVRLVLKTPVKERDVCNKIEFFSYANSTHPTFLSRRFLQLKLKILQ